MLEVKNYSLEYIKGIKVVEDLNMTIEKGDIYGFVGKNGAGKSTTIKSIVGINHISNGDILIDGISIQDKSLEYKKKIAYVPDEPILYENLTGIQYLNFIADIFLLSEKERKKRIKKYSKVFDLYDDLNNLIRSYSHGMKQKLMLISALIHDPLVYILDEPFASLDPESAYNLKFILKEESLKGKIILFSTHVLEVAEKLCNKIAIIKDGKLVVSGVLDEIIKDKSLEETFMEISK